MARPNNFQFFPYFPPPSPYYLPPPHVPPPHPPVTPSPLPPGHVPSPPVSPPLPPHHPIPPPPPPPGHVPSPPVSPPPLPPHHPIPPPPPPGHVPSPPLSPPLPPHHPTPPPPLPPHPIPPAPASPPGHHSPVIIFVFVSVGGVFFLAFLAAALLCWIKKRKKKIVQETDKFKIDEHVEVHEDIVPGPHGTQKVVLTIDDDILIEEEIKRNVAEGKGSYWRSSEMSSNSTSESNHHNHHRG